MKYDNSPPDRTRKAIRMKKLLEMFDLKSKNTVYDWLKETSPRYKPAFPAPFKIGAGTYWYEDLVWEFIDSCASGNN